MIAARLTFWGMCEEASRFYVSAFRGRILEKSLFEDHSEQFPAGLSKEMRKLIFSVTVQLPDEEKNSIVIMGDSPVMVLSGKQERGACKDNVVFDVALRSVPEVERIYKVFMNNGAKCNIPLCIREHYERYGSLIDRFGVCWNLYSPSVEEWRN
jgi:uncharacterized glyoxalase superfamily protein PhnB